MKICLFCGKAGASTHGLRKYCSTLCKNRAYRANQKKKTGHNPEYNRYHKAKVLGVCPYCGKLPVTGRVTCEACAITKRRCDKVARTRLRQEVLIAYGGKCACCGEDTPEFLGIDHINGGGLAERKKFNIKAGDGFYRWLKRHGFPKDEYQLLCHNCNLAKGFYGSCPHQREKSDSN